MASLNNQQIGYGNQQIPVQYPYNNNLIMNTPYENYLGRSQQNFTNQFLKCRPVASKEQARAAQIDLDGSLWVFTDVGNQTADEDPYSSPEYVTKEEFNKVIQGLMAVIHPMNNESVSNNENKQPAITEF